CRAVRDRRRRGPDRMTALVDLLTDVPAATARYDVRDDLGRSMDTLKVIAAPAGGYLAVYHSGIGNQQVALHVATSADLLTWTHRAELDRPASQPTIAALDNGGFLVGLEAGGGGPPPGLRFVYYASADRLLAGTADRIFDAPHTLVPRGRHAEGTPNIYSVRLGPDLDQSEIDAGFHYFRRRRVH